MGESVKIEDLRLNSTLSESIGKYYDKDNDGIVTQQEVDADGDGYLDIVDSIKAEMFFKMQSVLYNANLFSKKYNHIGETKYKHDGPQLYQIVEGGESAVPADQSSKQGLQKINYIIIKLLFEGEMKKIIVTPKELDGFNYPQIKINGQMISMIISTNGKEKVSFAGVSSKEAVIDKITEQKKSQLELGLMQFCSGYEGSRSCLIYHTADLAAGVADVDFIASTNSQPDGRVFGFGNLSYSDLASPMDAKEIKIDIKGDEFQYGIAIHQSGIEPIEFKLGEHTRSMFGDDFSCFYQGGNLRSVASGTADMDLRLTTMIDAICKIENLFGTYSGREIHLIGQKVENGTAEIELGRINIYLDTFTGNLDVLRSTAEHEALHFITKELYGDSLNVRMLFADIYGYEGESRDAIIDGEMFVRWQQTNNMVFFKFINETNYLGLEGGHSADNVWEFLTSFCHTLMYIDKLEDRLSQYSADEQIAVLQLYEKTLSTLIKSSGNITLNRWLESRLTIVKSLLEKRQ